MSNGGAGRRKGLPKPCADCSAELPAGARNVCARCHRVRMRIRRGVDPTDALLEPPGHGRCEICGSQPEGGLFLDHDHETGRLRGWLCNGCNLAIAHLTEAAALEAAIAYLARPPRPARSPPSCGKLRG